MRHAAAATLLLLLGGVQAKDKNESTTATHAPQTRRPPLTLAEKIKREKGNKDTGPAPGIDTRVIGGTQVTATTKYRYYVEWESIGCGGSLIHDDIVLTAGHCESSENPFGSRVFVNGITSEGGIFRTIEQQVSHPLYKVGSGNDYDFLILKLHTSALVDATGKSTGAEKVALNSNRDVPKIGNNLMAMGFGLTVEGANSMSNVLNDVQLKYVDDNICIDQYDADTFVPDVMFCAGVPGGGKDTCQGDSGGPIMDVATNTQVGVVSFGVGCGRATHNGIYARVSAASSWIKQQVCLLTEYPLAGCPTKPANGGIGSGSGAISITVTYDKYASELGLSLVYAKTGTNLFFHRYDSEQAVDDGTKKFEFKNLPAGDYTLMVGDDGRDGICCDYGNGKVLLTDDKNGAKIWEVSQFGEYIQATFSIDSTGKATFKEETEEYLNSWELSPDPPNYPQDIDAEWPGPKPASAKGLNINVKFDKYPTETHWTLKKLSGTSWTEVEALDGATDGIHNDMVSVQLTNLAEGWYSLEVKDRGSDGICCAYRRGWVAVTGYLAVTRKSGLVWGNNGDYGDGTTVYLQMASNGMLRQTSESSPI